MRITVKGPYTAVQILRRPELHQRLKQLTNGGFGRKSSTLYPLLKNLKKSNKDKFWLAWNNGQVVAWLWMEPPRSSFYCGKINKVSTIGTFVHREFRRKGIGKRLIDRLLKQTPKNLFFNEEAWNQAGINLYENLENRNYATRCLDQYYGVC